MNDILTEVADKYDSLSKNQKNALAESIAGTTQINLFNSLMNNWKQVAKYQEEYKKGMTLGSAAKEKQNSPYVQKCA